MSRLFEALADSDDSAYLLSRDRRILATNAGWRRFAMENGAPELAQGPQRELRVDDAIDPTLRAFYVDAFERVIETGERWTHDYDCSSPESYRRYRMIVYPAEHECLVVASSVLVDVPHAEVFQADAQTYARDGVVVMCAHCRRVRNPKGTLRWDWVPAYVRTCPANLSHGLCEACSRFYYGALLEAAESRAER